MPWLGAILASFGVFLVERLGKYLIGLGVFGATYVGVDKLVDKVFGNMSRNIGGGVSAAYDILMMAGFGVALNVMLSACAFALALSAARSASA